VVVFRYRFSNGWFRTYTTQTTAGCTSRHQVLLLMHNPLHQQLQQQDSYAANMCNCNRQFQITGYSIIHTYTFTPSSKAWCRISNRQFRYLYLHKLMQQDVHRQYHQVLLLMHNPLHQQLNSRYGNTQPTCSTATGGFQITGYTHPIPILYSSVVSILVQV
jgi:hypothetical protein